MSNMLTTDFPTESEYREFVKSMDLGGGLIEAAMGLIEELHEHEEHPSIDEAGDVLFYATKLDIELEKLVIIKDITSEEGRPIDTLYMSLEDSEYCVGIICSWLKRKYRNDPNPRLHDNIIRHGLRRIVAAIDYRYELIYVRHANMLKLYDRKDRNVLHGEGDNR